MKRQGGIQAAIGSMIRRLGEPVIRTALRRGMRVLARQFVMGRTIYEALARANSTEGAMALQLRHAGRGSADARRCRAVSRARTLDAIGAIGRKAGGRGPIEAPGISVKLSALHPRYEPLQAARCVPALIGTLSALAPAAKASDIGMTVDAEEADRLEISLDVFAAVLGDAQLDRLGWLGFAVQAYQKRALPLIDWIAALGRRTRHRVPVRLVKGAYWDSEIKLAQVQGHADYPVFTRKAATDVSWLACARRMLDCREAIYPAFATHNAHSLRGDSCWKSPGRRLRNAAAARHGRGALPRCDMAGARLCAGRHARGPAGVSGAAAAGKWRQYQLRASAGRSRRCRRRRSSLIRWAAVARPRRPPPSAHSRSAALASLSCGAGEFRRRSIPCRPEPTRPIGWLDPAIASHADVWPRCGARSRHRCARDPQSGRSPPTGR